MADSKPTPPPSFVFNKDVLLKRIEEIKAKLGTFAGKAGYNPFTYAKNHVTPLVNRLTGSSTTPPETSKQLHDSIMSIDPSKLDPKV